MLGRENPMNPSSHLLSGSYSIAGAGEFPLQAAISSKVIAWTKNDYRQQGQAKQTRLLQVVFPPPGRA
jgi:hypothetical protein